MFVHNKHIYKNECLRCKSYSTIRHQTFVEILQELRERVYLRTPGYLEVSIVFPSIQKPFNKNEL